MPKVSVKVGTTSYLARIFIQDASSTTGAGLTGLTSGSAGLVASRARDDDGNAGGTAIVLSGGTRGTWSSGGFVEKDATNLPGVYELGVPDAALAAGSKSVLIMLKGATNMAPLPLEIELTAVDNQDATAYGVSRIDAAITTRMATFTLPTNFAALAIDASGRMDLGKWIGIAPNALQSGRVDAILGAVTAGAIGAAAFAAGALDAVWSTATRLLTAGTNIVLAKGVGLTGLNDIAAADVWAAATRTLTAFGFSVTVGINNDKTGYTLTQTFPTNFSSLGIDASGNAAIQSAVKKNVARAKFPFVITDSTTHAPKPGLGAALTATRSIDGGAFAAGTLANPLEVANGVYMIDCGAGDLNGSCIMLRVTAAGADDTFVLVVTDP